MKISFRPARKGVAQFLGELESAVMREVWERPDSSARTILENLSPRRILAYTTVVTILSRLFKKGLLTRRREGRAFLYSPGITHKEFNHLVTQDVLSGLLKDGSRPTLTTFVDLVATDEKLLAELEELVRSKRK